MLLNLVLIPRKQLFSSSLFLVLPSLNPRFLQRWATALPREKLTGVSQSYKFPSDGHSLSLSPVRAPSHLPRAAIFTSATHGPFPAKGSKNRYEVVVRHCFNLYNSPLVCLGSGLVRQLVHLVEIPVCRRRSASSDGVRTLESGAHAQPMVHCDMYEHGGKRARTKPDLRQTLSQKRGAEN